MSFSYQAMRQWNIKVQCRKSGFYIPAS